jgi:tetrapyrrole methylase family protein/MazG family protein
MFLWVFKMTGERRDKTFNGLVSIVERLRSPQGCAWDREQTMESLRTYLIEEVYEVIEAIDQNDPEALREELGDLLFHILFLSYLAKEQKKFDIWDVIVRISEKMVSRHPHVFGEKKVSSSKEVAKSWSDLKEQEKVHRRSILEGIPQHLPALLRAYRITEKASHVGFDWEKTNDIFEKLDEEIGELKDSLSQGNRTKIEDEVGDILFVLVNLARRTGNNPEEALRKTTRKFTRRFHHIERELETSNRNLKKTSLEEMDRLWEQAKGNE